MYEHASPKPCRYLQGCMTSVHILGPNLFVHKPYETACHGEDD